MDKRYWLGFNKVPGYGPARIRALLQRFSNLENAWHADATNLRAIGMPRDAIESLLYFRTKLDLDAEMAQVADCGIDMFTWDDPEYPELLRNIAQPPPLIYVRGEITPPDALAIAVVGTRKITSYGKSVTRDLVSGLVSQGVTIVSGLALGTDGIAHSIALENSGRTLAVLGCGLDTIYPARHRELARQICSAGALISDYAPGVKPEARNFPPRNRIISGLALGTLVVEAGEKSGALITIRYALDQGRETFAVPGSMYSPMSKGTNATIRKGEAKLVTCVQDILEEINLSMIVEQKQVSEIIPDTPLEASLLDLLGAEPVQLDDLVRQTHLAANVVSSTICMMELKGMVHRVDTAAYVIAH